MEHNLDIQSYSLGELLTLLELPAQPTEEHMKSAKKRVLMMHPDKSKLSPEYFIFYRKAYELSLQYYEEYNKVSRKATAENTNYNSNYGKDVHPEIKKNATKVSHDDFNRLYEENMVEKREYKNEWFKGNEPTVDIGTETVNAKNMSSVMYKIKEKQQAMSIYRGVQEFAGGYHTGTNSYYEEEEENNSYISCDPFAKLKYDDLRKVHKDQTVFDVSEQDFDANTHGAGSIDKYQKQRDVSNVAPLEKQEAERILAQKELLLKEQYAKRLHNSTLQGMRYDEKNKNVEAAFLRLT